MMFLMHMHFLYTDTPGEYSDHTYDVVLDALSASKQLRLIAAINN